MYLIHQIIESIAPEGGRDHEYNPDGRRGSFDSDPCDDFHDFQEREVMQMCAAEAAENNNKPLAILVT